MIRKSNRKSSVGSLRKGCDTPPGDDALASSDFRHVVKHFLTTPPQHHPKPKKKRESDDARSTRDTSRGDGD